MSRVVVTYKTGFRLDDWIYFTLSTQYSGLQAIQRYRNSTNFAVHRNTHTKIQGLH
jgi:hypothetical protein